MNYLMEEFKEVIDKGIPFDSVLRKDLYGKIKRFVEEIDVRPPVTIDILKDLADRFIAGNGVDKENMDWIMVFINNALWSSTVASIPYERRILLLPQCLKDSRKCSAKIDDFGLLCERCGSCLINTLEANANDLGMMTIVSEGFSMVVSLIESGQIDTVIGVACLESLEKVFPLLVENAIPGIAIPLTKAGCIDTEVDHEMVLEAIGIRNDITFNRIFIEDIRKEVSDWFKNEYIFSVIGNPKGKVERIAIDWMTGKGHRWRPSLLAAVYKAVSGDHTYPEKVRLATLAVEAFHKASLVHDDIEDRDDFRYGDETLHKRYGVEMAINVGDYLLGCGYRLLMADIFSFGEKAIMGKVASTAHCDLCSGQGLDLEWSGNKDIEVETVVEIAKLKTVPAFRVAIDYGAFLAGADNDLRETLVDYSNALGVAYQLKDDIEDSSIPTSLEKRVIKEKDQHIEEAYRLARGINNRDLSGFLVRLTSKMVGEPI